jgi:hypothetical protein
MKALVIVAALLVSAGPSFAEAKHTATAAQWKDIRKLQQVFGQCGGRTNPEMLEKDLNIRKACALSGRLQDKLIAQGFCFYGRIDAGKPGKLWTQKQWEQATEGTTPVPKNHRSCEPLSNPPRWF